MYWLLLHLLGGRGTVPDPADSVDRITLDKVPVTFRECEGICEPTAGQIEAKERERAEQFKGDQLLQIMGFGGGSPSPPS